MPEPKLDVMPGQATGSSSEPVTSYQMTSAVMKPIYSKTTSAQAPMNTIQ